MNSNNKTHKNLQQPVHFIKELIPLFKAAKKPAAIAVTTSGLALAPGARMPGCEALPAAYASRF